MADSDEEFNFADAFYLVFFNATRDHGFCPIPKSQLTGDTIYVVDVSPSGVASLRRLYLSQAGTTLGSTEIGDIPDLQIDPNEPLSIDQISPTEYGEATLFQINYFAGGVAATTTISLDTVSNAISVVESSEIGPSGPGVNVQTVVNGSGANATTVSVYQSDSSNNSTVDLQVGSNAPVKLATAAGVAGYPTLTQLLNGTDAAVWVDYTSSSDPAPETLRYAIIGANGAILTPDSPFFSVPNAYTYYPNLLALPNGDLALAFATAGGAIGGEFIQIFSPTFATIGAPKPVNVTSGLFQASLAMASLQNNQFAVAWASQENTDFANPHANAIRMRLYNDDGAPATGEVLVDTGTDTVSAPTITAMQGGVIVGWTDLTTNVAYDQYYPLAFASIQFRQMAKFASPTAVTLSGMTTDSSPLSSVHIMEGASQLGAATFKTDGSWTAALTLAQGTYNALSVVATDSGGNSVTTTAPFTLAIAGNVVTQINTDKSEVISHFNVTGQNFTSTIRSLDTSGNLTSVEHDGVTGAPYDAYKILYSGTNASGLTQSGLNLYYANQTSGLSEIRLDGGGNLWEAKYSFAGTTPGSRTGLTVDYVAGQTQGALATYLAPTGANYSTYAVEYNNAFQYSGAVYTSTYTGQTYNKAQYSYSAGSQPTLTEATFSQYTGWGGPDKASFFYDGSGMTTGVQYTYSGVVGQLYNSQTLLYNSSNVLVAASYCGYTTKPFSSQTYFYNSSGAVLQIVRDFDSATSVGSINGQAYNSYQKILNPSFSVLGTAYHLDNGGNVYLGVASGVNTPTFGAAGVSANEASISDILDGGDWTITGGGTGETFNFGTFFNQAQITDYGAAFGGATDVVSVSTQDFANWQTMLGDASASGVGGANTTFTSTTTGDKLTLDGVTLTQLQGLTMTQAQTDFLFHP